MVGLSTRALLWRCFSQFIVFLYLFDQKTSLLVLIPSGAGVIVEAWKVKKAFRMTVSMENGIPRLTFRSASEAEEQTDGFDSEAMHYLVYLLLPICIGGSCYSLLYTSHKSWYSWIVQSAANGVYAFGFLFMLPQLFVNYKLKSVSHLPWRVFMYKAFNTFIDDLFAFIITMPTAHRMACFRDDVVFLIYLYQRYLYPVDKTRPNEYDGSVEVVSEESKKTK
uniref:Lipid scramblase CLPTM1L n=1 Tax=Steinernema glaseri TaxID=37863 RepID=A0A1I7ZUK2_9BILA